MKKSHSILFSCASLVALLACGAWQALPLAALVRAADADYWDANLPIRTDGIAAPHATAPYTCGVNYYVSGAGSDSNNGSQASPWLTISHAVAVLNARGGPQGGVCINVDDGIYPESVNAGALSGSSDTPGGYFVLRSVHPHRAVIQVPANAPDFSHGIGFWNAKFIRVLAQLRLSSQNG